MKKRLRVLTWHVHGNYLYYLSQIPHELYLVTRPGFPPGYAGRCGALPWGPNVHEVAADRLAGLEVDCVLYQHRDHYHRDRLEWLTPAQRRLPAIYLEHDPPQAHPTATLHPVQDPQTLLVHVTPFNALMWDSGPTPARVIEHGVLIDPAVRYDGGLARGVCAVNHLGRRGRRLGVDLFRAARQAVPIDLVGMASEEEGGLGEIPNPELPAFLSHYRFFFHPVRYTSLGLALVEAMAIGMPVVALAVTEVATVIRSGVNGIADTRPEVLIGAMRALLADPEFARELGREGMRTARKRFGIERFVADWDTALREVAG
ncbi:glycosyltransferase [Cupriavidus malaysiensis]|uniref:LPS biosynthesis transferase n=1 Tax=Cupriavidus malaysiensis TaxID=367825 RepID=A0ABM6FFA8_9BURK|nr:glycosyltransferase family 4 protein [Cupriavidus malaysiensis]AOZ10597.1 LPS biosynthesis transferase [Cupriavidus malaysiensis]